MVSWGGGWVRSEPIFFKWPERRHCSWCTIRRSDDNIIFATIPSLFSFYISSKTAILVQISLVRSDGLLMSTHEHHCILLSVSVHKEPHGHSSAYECSLGLMSVQVVRCSLAMSYNEGDILEGSFAVKISKPEGYPHFGQSKNLWWWWLVRWCTNLF